MAPVISTFVVLSSVLFITVVQADVSHLGYNRLGRIQNTRLQRLESGPKPYAASGFRPNRQFNLPREQPLFPLASQQPQNNKQNSNGFENLGETQRPELTYGAPAGDQTRFPQVNQPQNNNGFINLAEPQRPESAYEAPVEEQSRFPITNQPENNNGFDNLAEPQRPESTYGAPARLSQLQSARLRQLLSARLQQQQPQQFYSAPQNNGFNNLAEPQQPQVIYSAPARLRQPQSGRLQQVQPQQIYAAPQQFQASQAERFIGQKPARLTDNREDREDEEDDKTAEASADIETDNKSEDKKKTAAPQTPQTITYFPAGAVSFVQPVNSPYVAAGIQTLQPVSSAYTVASPFFQQPYTFSAPAQLQAW